MAKPFTRAALAVLSLALLPMAGRSEAAASRHLLYKCVDAKAVTSIQSTACPAGSTTVWKRDAPPDAAPTPEGAEIAAARKQRDQQAVRDLSRQVEKIQKAAEDNAAAPRPSADDDAAPASAPPAAASLPPPAPDPDLQACQDAQSFANAAREKDWLGLTEEQIRRLYGWVAAQCKVPTAG